MTLHESGDGQSVAGVDRGSSPERTRRDPTLSCILPCRNDARNLNLLLPCLIDMVSSCVQDWEIIIVDDGSTDTTALALEDWSTVLGVRAIQLSRHFGKSAAFTAGLQSAIGEVVVMMDADLQHDPELIPMLLQRWREGADMVYAVRQDRLDESLVNRLETRFLRAFGNSASGLDMPAGASDFRLLDRKVVDALLALPEGRRFMQGLYAWIGFYATAVPYVPAPRHGNSRSLRPIRILLDGLTASTTWPLRLVSLMGFAVASMAFVYGGYLSFRFFLYGHTVSGLTTIVVGLMLYSGIQLFSLGIVGEYVGRIFEEAMERPLFVVKRELGHGLKVTRP